MKERLPIRQRLTNQTPNHRLVKEGVPPMPEEGKEVPQPQEPHKPTAGNEKKIVPPEKIETAKKAWEAQNEAERKAGKPLSLDLSTQNTYIQSGVHPHRTPEYARKAYEELAKKQNRSLTESEEESIRLGMPPMSGGTIDIDDVVGKDSRTEAFEKIKEFYDILSRPEVLAELKKKNPDFNDRALTPLKEFIDKIDISQDSYRFIAAQVARLNTDIHGKTEAPNRISEESRRLMYEWVYEKLIGRPDKGSEEAPYSVGSLQLQSVLDELNTLAMSEFSEILPGEKKNFGTYLSELGHVRQVMHDLRRNLENGEQYKEYVLGHLRTAGLNFVQNELAGAGSVIRLYEKISSNRVAQRKEWFNQGDLEAIKEEVKEVFEKSNPEKDGRPLTDWEMARALRVGGIMFAGTQRMAMYSALGDIPSWAVSSDRVASLPYEYIGRAIVPFKMTASRFWAYEKGGPRKYMEMILKEQEAKDKEGTYMNLFGLDNRTMMLNSYGAVDPESHGWRSQLMFLGPIRLEIGETKMSLLELLNKTARKHDAVPADPILGGGDVADKGKFSKDVSDVILGQRLYLSILQRYGNFDANLKTDIWKKIALLKPSTIASLSPEVLTGQEKVWEELRMKLYAAEDKRVAKDGRLYKESLKASDMDKEKTAFLNTLPIAEKVSWTSGDYRDILKYAGLEGLELSPEEKDLLGIIMREGVKKAGEFARAKMPFAFAVDDAPYIAWAKTGDGITGLADEDLFRILLSDQKHLAEGWGEINGLVESPTHGAMEHISKAVEGIGTVHGRGPAQETIEPFIVAYLKFVSTDEGTLWTPGAKTIKKLLNIPTSEIGRFYRSSYLSMDESERRQFLLSLSQAKAVSDNKISAGNKLTQLERIGKETKSDKGAELIGLIRMIILIFGPVAGKEFIRLMLPQFK